MRTPPPAPSALASSRLAAATDRDPAREDVDAARRRTPFHPTPDTEPGLACLTSAQVTHAFTATHKAINSEPPRTGHHEGIESSEFGPRLTLFERFRPYMQSHHVP
eukprot:357859-Chlamydomonas_euryale.AAC.2